MPLHFAARLHAFTHGLFRPSDEAQTRALYAQVEHLFDEHGIADEEGRDLFMLRVAEEVSRHFGMSDDHDQAIVIWQLVRLLFEYEKLFLLPKLDWSERRSVTEYWEIRDWLNLQRRIVENFQESCGRLPHPAGFMRTHNNLVAIRKLERNKPTDDENDQTHDSQNDNECPLDKRSA